jgi:hypothetical protein
LELWNLLLLAKNDERIDRHRGWIVEAHHPDVANHTDDGASRLIRIQPKATADGRLLAPEHPRQPIVHDHHIGAIVRRERAPMKDGNAQGIEVVR